MAGLQMSVGSVLTKVAERLVEEAPELIPIASKALLSLLAGESPEKALTQAERDLIATRSQAEFDEALRTAHGTKPNTGV
jgi:hypothetical protein